MLLLPPPALEVLRLRLLPKRRRRKKRVRPEMFAVPERDILMHLTEKEESDEDMGFGLFD